ncbi:hypothetical protein KAR48_08245 [bacterium]|nr:hypothetical protein [bacterium]
MIKTIIGIVASIILGLTISNMFNTNDSRQNDGANTVIGVKIYEYDGDMQLLFDRMVDLGINTVFASPQLLSRQNFRDEAKATDMHTFVIIPTFYNPDHLKINPDDYAITQHGSHAIEEWVEFVCPSRKIYRQKHVQYIKDILRKTDADGLSIDFIRHFVFWEKIYPDTPFEDLPETCFCDSCVSTFFSDAGITPARKYADIHSRAAWIREHHRDAWTNWKCRLINDWTNEIIRAAHTVKPDIMINIHALPWHENDYDGAIRHISGQAIEKLAINATYISPMTYSHMLKQTPEWIHSVVKDFNLQTTCKIIPSIQVGKAYLDEPVDTNEFEHGLISGLKHPSSGIIFWNWDHLAASPEKQRIVKNHCN